MNTVVRRMALVALCSLSSLQAGLLDWFSAAPTYQVIADTAAHAVLKQTKVSIAQLEEGFKGAPVKLEDGSFSTFKPVADGQFVLRWQKKDDPSKTVVTRVFADRTSEELLLPDSGQIAPSQKEGSPTYFVYYGSPSNKLFKALLSK